MKKISLINTLKKTFKTKKANNKKKSLKSVNKQKKRVVIKSKKIIIEALWDIIYSDEDADMYETNLMRRLSGLLYLDAKVVGDIKEKVSQKKK